jgi:hypothetical protein
MERVTPAMLGGGEMMLLTDPPLHGAMGRAFNRLMLPRAVGRFEVPGALLVREILDQAVARSECDFVVDVAAHVDESEVVFRTDAVPPWFDLPTARELRRCVLAGGGCSLLRTAIRFTSIRWFTKSVGARPRK